MDRESPAEDRRAKGPPANLADGQVDQVQGEQGDAHRPERGSDGERETSGEDRPCRR